MDEPAFPPLTRARVAVVGLGLMGGSLALALRGRCAEIVGVDSDLSALAAARDLGCVDRPADLEAALDCDVLILATPVRAILSILERLSQLGPRPARLLVLDLGSTKRAIAAAMANLPAGFDPVGGHPLCGKEVNGLAHAEADLFRGRAFVLTRAANTSDRALGLARAIVAAIGATPRLLTADAHDALVALTSHVPYLAAAGLIRAALARADDGLWPLAASGFRDATRLAASDVTMMVDILLTNRGPIREALVEYRDQIDVLIDLIDAGDPDALRQALAPIQARRAELFR